MDSLHAAARDGDLENVRKLISAGADVNTKKIDGSTPLHESADKGHADTVMHEFTSLHYSARKGHADTVRALIAAGTDVNAKEVYGRTPLHLSSCIGNTDVVRALIAVGADVNIKDWHGYTALMDSARKGHTDIVRALIAAEADVNIKHNHGGTALHLSAEVGQTDILRALIVAGASISEKDDFGRTALDESRRREVAETLIKYSLLFQDKAKLKPIMERSCRVYNEVWIECGKQVDKMKETWLGGSRVSFYEFITETDKNKLALYLTEENFGIKTDLERLAYIKKFPVYTEDMEAQFNEGMERANLLHKSREFVRSCFYDILPEDIIRKISENMI